MGTQMPRPPIPQHGPQRPAPSPVEPVTSVVHRAFNAHGGQAFRAAVDSVAEGTLTRYGMQGPYEQVPVIVWRKGDSQVMRTIRSATGEQRQGLNRTQTWDATGPFVTLARGPALEFLEMQTVRSLPNLFDYQARGSRLRDDGMRGNDRAVTIEELNGRSTTYVINSGTSYVSRMEVVTDQAPNMFGREVSVVQSYVFSNFRMVQGVPTPFKIEHFTNDLKVEEIVFTTFRYNNGLTDDIFHP